MIWIASFPRSGNTFLRNILFDVYGLASSTYHHESAYPIDENFDSYPFVKTHELPSLLTLEGFSQDIPTVYLVRDGRDTICSIAHHRSDLIAPGSDYFQNMVDAIVADRGSFFGGWSLNIEEWVARADLVIRFEDLVREPLATVERLRQVCDLPAPNISILPTFESMKAGIPEYGAGRHHLISEAQKHLNAEKFFRRGESGVWREEMPAEFQELFWSFHGETMDRLGYSKDGILVQPDPDLDARLRLKLGISPAPSTQQTFRVLMEADKLISNDNDGVKRYQVELLRAMFPATDYPGSPWKIDLYCQGSIAPLGNFRNLLFKSFTRQDIQDGTHLEVSIAATQEPPMRFTRQGDENHDVAPVTEDTFRPEPSIFLRFERWLTGLVPRRFVSFLSRHNITALHDVYEVFRSLFIGVGDLFFKLSLPVLTVWRKIWGMTIRNVPDDEGSRYDLVHIPLKQNYGPFQNDPTPKLITFHDLTHLHFPQYHTRKNIENAALGVEYAEKCSADIIAVSEATRNDVLHHTSIPADKLHVIPEAADPRKFCSKVNKSDCREVRRRYGMIFEEPYIICLSTVEPRKNLKNTIRAYLKLKEEHGSLRLKLVIAGKKGWDAEGVYELATRNPDDILFTGFVDDADLPYLYSDALCLSYLSFYEGFGLPALEAMRCGTPVVFGNNSSLIEVVQQGGLPADPYDINNIGQQYLALYQQPKLRAQKARAAIRQANRYSWRRTALETLKLYRELINANR